MAGRGQLAETQLFGHGIAGRLFRSRLRVLCSFGGVGNKPLLQYLEVTLQACRLQNVISLHCLVYKFLLDYVSKTKKYPFSLQARIHLLSGSDITGVRSVYLISRVTLYPWQKFPFGSTPRTPTQHHFCYDEPCSVS